MNATRRIGQRCAGWFGLALIASMAACSGGPVIPDRTVSTMDGLGVVNAGEPMAVSSGAAAAISLRTTTADSKVGFDLTNGTFTITSLDGDISGPYVGRVSVSSSRRGRSDASLSVQVTSGTGLFQGATGTLTGDGTGAFIGEGDFSLSLRGSIMTVADPKGLRVQGTISGTTSLSCIAPTLIATLSGDGSLTTIGTAHAVLTHQIGNAGCF